MPRFFVAIARSVTHRMNADVARAGPRSQPTPPPRRPVLTMLTFLPDRATLPIMSTVLRTPDMTREQFVAWVQADGGRWEFDGSAPVAMTGGTVNHSRISRNLHAALRSRLQGGPCEPLGPDAGLATIGDA